MTVGTSFGDAILAHLAFHSVVDYHAISASVSWDEQVKPVQGPRGVYDRSSRVNSDLYDDTKAFGRSLPTWMPWWREGTTGPRHAIQC